MTTKKTTKKKALQKKISEEQKDLRQKQQKRLIAIISLLAVVCAILILILLIQTGTITNPLTITGREAQVLEISDECSLIAGQLIHTINDDPSCELRCKTNCDTIDREYESHEFITRTNDCNECSCYCR